MHIRHTQGGSIELGELDFGATTSSLQHIYLPRATFTNCRNPDTCLAVVRTPLLDKIGLASLMGSAAP